MSKQTEALKLALELALDVRANASVRLATKAIALTGVLDAALAEQPSQQQQELDELTAQRDWLADILTRTANALKGQPAELSSHSWHDLPEVAQQIKAAQQQQEPVKACVTGQCPCKSECDSAQCCLYTSPQPSKPFVGLTDEEMLAVVHYSQLDNARAVENILREKNT